MLKSSSRGSSLLTAFSTYMYLLPGTLARLPTRIPLVSRTRPRVSNRQRLSRELARSCSEDESHDSEYRAPWRYLCSSRSGSAQMGDTYERWLRLSDEISIHRRYVFHDKFLFAAGWLPILTDSVDLAWLHRSACHSILLVSDSICLILELRRNAIAYTWVYLRSARGTEQWRLLVLSHVHKTLNLRLWKEV